MVSEVVGTFPAAVYLQRGSFVERFEGSHDTMSVRVRVGKADLAWPIAHDGGNAMYEKGDLGTARMFLVTTEFPEWALPWEEVAPSHVEWRKKVLGRGEAAAALVKPEARHEARKLEIIKACKEYGSDGARSERMARVLVGVNNPHTTGEMFHRAWLAGLMEQVETQGPVLLGMFVFGALEGWQLGQTVLPKIANSLWFSMLLPLLMVGGILWYSFRSR